MDRIPPDIQLFGELVPRVVVEVAMGSSTLLAAKQAASSKHLPLGGHQSSPRRWIWRHALELKDKRPVRLASNILVPAKPPPPWPP